jgi:cardiolipin synthase
MMTRPMRLLLYSRSACVVMCALWGLVVACSSLPEIPSQPRTTASPRLVGANGELPPERSMAILDAVERRRRGSELLARHLLIEETITDLPLVVGNRVTLLQDGPATYKAMYVAIRAAKDHINLETYILEDDEIGRQLADLLLEKRARSSRSCSCEPGRSRKDHRFSTGTTFPTSERKERR